jgi:hypothetical protein
MLRAVFEYLVPFLLPTLLYALWLIWQRRRAAAGGARVPAWQEGPWFWLVIAGFALAFLAFVASALLLGHAPGARYIPPQLRDGTVQPGHFQ